MNRRRIAFAGIAGLAAAGTTLGLTLHANAASTPRQATSVPATAEVSEPTSPDTDTVQQGDQTTPDTAVVTKMVAVKSAVKSAGEATSETSTETSSETEAASDGPGGHADPPGDVQHEGGDSER